MPFYDFKCSACSSEFDELASFDETGVYEGVFCPKCGSSKKNKIPSLIAAPVNRDSHDYKFNSRLPQIIEQRQQAELASHMGGNPYGAIDDISSGEHFGDVK